MKRKISKPQYAFLQKEFSFWQQQGKLNEDEANDLLALYETKSANVLRLLLVFGAILVGVGILSFIAGNWSGLTPLFKFFLILLGFLLFYVLGFKLESNYEKTARSMYYIGAAIYGAGIFLIGQTFHLQHTVYSDFLLWAIGILPLAYYLKDQLIAVFAAAFLLIYSFTAFDGTGIAPYWLLILLPLLFWMNEKRMGRKHSLFVMTALLTAAFIGNMLQSVSAEEWIILLIIFVLGVLLALFPVDHYRTSSLWTGSVLFGLTGISLTFPFFWRFFHIGFDISYIFAAVFIIIIMYFLKMGSLPAIIITCAVIYRYYADISYDFMPKSLFFIISGLLLIGFGFWFEKSRRETVKRHEE